MEYRLRPCGDAAALIELPGGIDPAVNDRVHAIAGVLSERRPPGLVEWVPAYRTVLVEYDPARLGWAELDRLVAGIVAEAGEGQAARAGRTVTLPVVYGGEAGPDLAAVAAHTGLAPEEVVRRHAGATYRVYCLGYSPGFCYLGGLDPALATPRLERPRVLVPAGAVGIAGPQTGVYPGAAPGGWRLIGRTPARLFDPDRDPPSLLLPGDQVRFEPVPAAEFAAQALPPAPAPDGGVGVRIISAGLQTTVQDLGRRGFQAVGVPVSGAADPRSLRVGNALVGNRGGAAALEITLLGPEVEFTGAAAFCLAGATFAAELAPAGSGSPRAVPPYTAMLAAPGDRLRVGPARQGCRAYLCVSGGIEVPRVLGSRSTDLLGRLGPFGGRPLQAGDWLPIGEPLLPPADLAGRAIPAELAPPPPGRLTVRVVPGPQQDAFPAGALEAMPAGEYRVSPRSDRQGLRLEGPKLGHGPGGADIISEGVPWGAVQVPAGGEPILLLAGRQTVGGYAKIAVAISGDAARAGQLRPGDRLRFRTVSLSEAHAIARAEARSLEEVLRFLQLSAARGRGEVSLGPVVIRSRLRPATASAAGPALEPGPAPPARSRGYLVRLEGREFQVQVEEDPV